jgi:integrase
MAPKSLTNKRAKPTYLEWHGGKLRVTVAIPLDVQPLIGLTRFKHPLNTDSLAIANALKGPHVQNFFRLIDEARKGNRMDPLVREALTLAKARREAASHSERAEVDDLIADRAHALAGNAIAGVPLADGSLHPVFDAKRERQAEEFYDLARGEAVPIDLHYQTYFEQLTTKPRTKADDTRAVQYLAKWCAQNGIRATIQEITKRRARLFIDALPALANGIGPATVKKYLNRLGCYWKWLEDREYAVLNVWRGVTVRAPLVLDHEKERPFTEDEMRRLLDGPASQHMHDLMRIAALSGARLDAIVDLRVGDCVDGVFRFKPQKRETAYRLVPIHSELVKIVARRTVGKAATADVFPEWPPPKNASSLRERSFKASNAFTVYRKVVDVDATLPARRRALTNFHSWRRFFISAAEQAGQPENIIAAVVGHKREGMTFGVYSSGPSSIQFKACVESVRLPEAKPGARATGMRSPTQRPNLKPES